MENFGFLFQKSLNNLKDELKQRDEIIDKLHKEQADYKAETDVSYNWI